jgi:hypothetical protein
MTSQEARALLSTYRPQVGAAGDARMTEALALVQRDPQLAQWFKQQQATDAVVRRALADIPVPYGLATRIIANRPSARSGFAWPDWLRAPALSAVAALLLLGFWGQQPAAPMFEQYRGSMVAFVDHPYEMDFHAETEAGVRQAMAGEGYPSTYTVPPGLHTYPLEGGCKRSWNGRKVSLICYGSHEQHKPDVWMFVAPADVLPDAPREAVPQYRQLDDIATAAWFADGLHYLVATELDEAALRQLLQGR